MHIDIDDHQFFKLSKRYEDIKSPENNLRSDGYALLFSNNILSGALILPEIASQTCGSYMKYGEIFSFYDKGHTAEPRDIPVAEILRFQTSHVIPVVYQGALRSFHVSILLAKYAARHENKMLNYKYFEALPRGKYFYSFDFDGVYLRHENGRMGFFVKSKEIH